ncbi:MAG: EamA family transporter RarD, partial [Planctomycetia bacterium]|nr:EamA family transporter RarD [Planctomycetia bacterium]
MESQETANYRAGLLFGLAAHACWGLMPLYVSRLLYVKPLEFLCHRIVWSCVLLVGMLWLTGKMGEMAHALRQRTTRRMLIISTILIGINWFVFLYGIASGQALQNSLGYYTNPLFNVLLGVLVLGERLRPGKWFALALAASGLIYLMTALGTVPWIAFGVASSFAIYGLARKLVPVDGLAGLSVETLLMTPLSAGYIGWLIAQGDAAFGNYGSASDALIIFSGPATVVPLLCFVLAARRLPLTTLGFLQYIGPTMQLLTAVFVFG